MGARGGLRGDPAGGPGGAPVTGLFSALVTGLFSALVITLPITSTACSDDAVVCAEVTAECAPLYEPTFENVFSTTLQPRCGVAGSACHAREGAQGGLIFADIDEAYDMLTGNGGNPRRVDAEALGCGELLSRLASSDPSRLMPPAAPLSEAELCAITQWVAMGANR
jgi:hypothetical protein